MKHLTKIIKACFMFMAVGFSLLAYSEEKPLDRESSYPKIISAILKADIELYSKEMSYLLDQPGERFFDELVLFKTQKGDNLFHLMAGVKSHQDYFAEEMQTLNSIFDLDSKRSKEFSEEGRLSLGGAQISIPYLEDTELGQAIYNRDLSAVVSTVNQLQAEEMSAIKLFQYMHIRTRQGESVKDLVSSRLSMSDLKYIREHVKSFGGDEDRERELKEMSLLFKIKNQDGFLPKDIAYSSGNLPAYNLFVTMENLEKLSMKDKATLTGAGLGLIIGAGAGASSYGSLMHIEPYNTFYQVLGSLAGGGLGLALGGFISGECYRIFQERKLKRLSNKVNSL